MANILIHTITFNRNNTLFGTFVDGDVLDVYVDDTTSPPFLDSTTGISVELNGSPLSSGPSIPPTGSFLGFNWYTLTKYNVQFCNSTYLVKTDILTSFPYGKQTSFADYPSCAVVPTVCDLIVVGIPEVIDASGELVADGQITVTSESTNAIEYKLGEDFTYGNGVSSGVFTGLLPGRYTIYLRDAKNCATSVVVVIGFNPEYSERFRLEYEDTNGFQTRILVKKREYVGASSDVCGGETPFELSLRGEGSDNKFEPILASSSILQVTSETDLQFLEVYTNDPNLYRVEYYKDVGSGFDILWSGKILPYQYSEAYKFPPYYVNITSSDGLPELKEFYLIQNDGQRYYGNIKLIKLIALLLKPIKLNLDILIGCNMYATGMDSTDSDDPFDQAYIDFEAIYLYQDLPSYETVLRIALEPFGCRIVQWNNRWNIVRVEEFPSEFDYRLFDSDGEYVSNGSFDPVKNIGTDVIFVNPDQNLEIQPGYGLVKVNYILGLKPNILKNGDFRLRSRQNEDDSYDYEIDKDGWTLVHSNYPLFEGYEAIDTGVAYTLSTTQESIYNTNCGEAYLLSDTYNISTGSNNQLKISIRCKVVGAFDAFFGTKFRSQLPYIKVRLLVKYGSNYLQGDGSWTTTENELIFYLTTTDQFQEFSIIAQQPTAGSPSTGEDFFIRSYHIFAYHAQFYSLSSLKAFATYSGGELIPEGYRTEMRDVGEALEDYLYYYELEETTDSEDGYELVRPNDYNSSTNPKQWRRKNRVRLGDGGIKASIDYISVAFLHNNERPFDVITRSEKAENNNALVLEKDIYFGSASSLVTSEYVTTSSSRNIHRIPATVVTTLVTTNILSYELIYAGYFRDSSGSGYENWTRDGFAEEDLMHSIFLKMYTAQYNRSWRLLRAAIINRTSIFGLLNVFTELDRVYIPIGITIDDKMGISDGEYMELMDSLAAYGNSGFTTGFNLGYR